ncbi:MAG: UTP--glucose-1-phosphate uridylyltransferase GalU [Xylanivirga thermophila]|jgi:UTP--glucose-1-phosphate uridylyltransferase|uniref:UTP--glucose-1-phosphate uridylyltransferase GalU n=1 Tax=Xylanivirga thermophila TaxID=2496273 RepID=UPI00101B9045|nr:UTP--glucose-1-phosphate uridylyltransferase GalU [Xylanivirga thermophila]
MKVRKAVIPAAGLGTRFLPATKAQPKEMLPIVDKPTIQYIVEEAIASGIESIIIVTGRNKRSIEDHFDKNWELEEALKKSHKDDTLKLIEDISNLVDIYYIRQKEPKGLGHAISCARAFIGDEPFAVLLGDDIVDSEVPCLKQLMDVFEEYNTTILGCQDVDKKDVCKYGIVDGKYIENDVYKVRDMIEKPSIEEAPSTQAILGRYIITPRIFDFLENTKPGAGGEIQLTDALKALAQEEAMYAYNFSGRRYDVGNKLGYLQATVEFAMKRDDIRDEFKEYLDEFIKSDLYTKDIK